MSFEWRDARLGDLCDFAAGSAFKQDAQGIAHGDYPFVKVSDMNLPGNEIVLTTANNFISEDVRKELKAKVHPTGATVFAKIGVALTTNRRRLLNRPTIIDNNMMAAIPKSGIVTERFLYYLLTNIDFNPIAAGTALPYLNVSDLRQIAVKVPSVDLQTRIAEILTALDDRITVLRETNATLESIAQALFKSWFVDFDPVRAKMEGRTPEGMDEATAALFPDGFETSELGEVPRGWLVQTFRDTIQIIGGGTPKTSNPDFWGGDIPWFSVVDAPGSSDVFVIDTEKHITDAGLHGSSTKLLPAGTTIISARGTVGKLALTGRAMAMNQSCYGLRGKAGDAYFTYFSATRLVQQLQQRAHGSVFDTITQDTFSGVHVAYPQAPVVQAFDATVDALMARIRENLLQVQTISTLRDTLLPRLISGQRRLDESAGAIHA